MKILSVIGARPQFVKEAVIQHEINKREGIQEVVVHTGQHYDENMSGNFFDVFSMKKPDYNLNINASSHGDMTGRMIINLEKLMFKEEPDLVVVYGDTNSTLAAAIAASKIKIPIAHIEAGLRQEPRDMPEEINRVLTDRISTFLFSPCENAVLNLKKENIIRNVHFVGDVMYDVFLKMKERFDDHLLDVYDLRGKDYCVMTMHRDFNVDNAEKLESILKGIEKISQEIEIVFPVHPRTQGRIQAYGLESYLKKVHLLKPLDYLSLMGLTQDCKFVITDSGGYQKESYFSGKNALVLMPDTSWIELVDQEINMLVDGTTLYEGYHKLQASSFQEGIYGDGHAAEKILDIIEEAF